MLLAYYGINQNEQTLRRKCKTQAIGTHPVNIVLAAREFNLEAYIETADLATLTALLKEDIPPIAITLAEQEGALISHALIFKKIAVKYVDVLDPLEGHQQMLRSEFNKLWSAAGNLLIVIKKRETGKRSDNRQ